MRRLTLLSIVVTVLAWPRAAAAGTVTITDYSSGYFASNAAGGGGPFLATTSGGPLGNASFVTFCLEASEHFSYGASYTYALNSGAMNGGLGGQTDPNYDPLSDATKWLYYQAVSGSFASWFATATGSALDTTVGSAFQYAFWYLEDEKTAGEIPSVGLTLANYALANQGAWNMLYADGHRVYAMNLTDNNGGRYQDQLGYERVSDPPQPVPEPASLLLLGTGLLFASRYVLSRRRRG